MLHKKNVVALATNTVLNVPTGIISHNTETHRSWCRKGMQLKTSILEVNTMDVPLFCTPKYLFVIKSIISYFSVWPCLIKSFSVYFLLSVSIFSFLLTIYFLPLILCIQDSHSLYFSLFSFTCISVSLLISERREFLEKSFSLNFSYFALPHQLSSI